MGYTVFGLSPRELKRQMRRLGLKVDVEELEDAESVIIETSSKRLIIDNPQVVIMKLRDYNIIYVTGPIVEEEKEAEEPSFSEEDVQFVASQAGVSLDEARKALEASQGDIAQAIMLLEAKKRA